MTSALSSSRVRFAVSAAAIALVAGAAGYGLGHLRKPVSQAPAGVAPSVGGKVLYWYDPMVPAQHFDKSGKSPMGMDMVPRYAAGGAAGESAGVRIDPSAQQNLGVRLAIVQRGDLASTIDANGVIGFNQRDVAIVQARSAGFVQRVYGRAPGDVVRAGAPIADLLIPAWGGAEAEFLAVKRLGDPTLTAAARQRLRLLGVPEGLIASVERGGRPQTIVAVSTPIGGAIQTLDVRQGMTVNAGQTLAQVSGLSTVWLDAAVPEAQTGSVRVGEPVKIDLAAFPGESVSGRVIDILPTAQADSRTLTVRVELPNRQGRLRPGMFATAHLGGESQPYLLVPSEAVIRTGKRDLVMVAGPDGAYQPVEVKVGRVGGGQTQVLAGLVEGQKVVASGQFLLDSEASLTGIAARPLAADAAVKPTPKPGLAETRGRIEALTSDSITISHEAVPQVGWPAMTMTFKLGAPGLAKGRKVGDRVVFAFEPGSGAPVIQRISLEAAR